MKLVANLILDSKISSKDEKQEKYLLVMYFLKKA
jgi:hypothetical protein